MEDKPGRLDGKKSEVLVAIRRRYVKVQDVKILFIVNAPEVAYFKKTISERRELAHILTIRATSKGHPEITSTVCGSLARFICSLKSAQRRSYVI